MTTYVYTFAHGVVADGEQCARVTHIPNGLDLTAEEWAALEGAPAMFIGARYFQVGRALVEVQDGYAAPYGVPIRWQPLEASP